MGFSDSLLCSLCYFLVILLHLATPRQLRRCVKQEDTYGRWIPVRGNESYTIFDQYFYPLGPGEALNFSQIWLPYNCSYHRFSNASIFSLVNYYIQHAQPTGNKVKLVFLGDSVTRGLYCSIARILAGSEVLGPLNNKACGGPDFGKHVDSNINYPFYDVEYFGGRLVLSFCFLTSFLSVHDHFDWKLEWTVTKEKPFAVIVNTGAWDFQPDTKIFPVKKEGHEECVTPNDYQVAGRRVSPSVNYTFRDMIWYANEYKVKLIYRNIHLNKRFGALCCDELVENMLAGTSWQIFDSRRISNDVFQSQMPDGLHIDRRDVHTIAEHLAIRKNAEISGQPYPGMLEMQLTQSFLNGIFHEGLKHVFTS
jgi:hypothetical protein